MKAKWLGAVALAMFAGLILTTSTGAQDTSEPPQASAPQLSQAQLDQMLAPIALYPDDLLAQVVMAAGYPTEVVDADRWLEDTDNAALKGDDLSAALDQVSWDPSVKSLVQFPQVLHMMDAQLDWTESLGEAFVADPNAVMDSIQRLRRQAQAAGKLRSNAQEVVSEQDGQILIAPAVAQTVYVPDYDPGVVYGDWAYPDDPPDNFPNDFGPCAYDDFGYCWFDVGIYAPFWGWGRWDWAGHRIDIDRGRYAGLNHGRQPFGGVWAHDPSHRQGVPYHSPAMRDRLQGAAARPDTAAARGYPSDEAARAPSIARAPPEFESYGPGDDARTAAERGASSRGSMSNGGSRGGFGGGSRGGGGGRGRR
ncbi:MAG: DUF3300 domain-containing protein [Caulobacteraceae bacterium]